MTLIRRRMRLWVAAWIVFQVASLSALVPRDCCAAHRPVAESKEPSCHETGTATETATADAPSAMPAGAHCPMHKDGRHGAGEPPASGCAMRGTCNGPMAALLALLSHSGVLTDSFELLPDLHAQSAAVPIREHPTSRLASPDPPPPRA